MRARGMVIGAAVLLAGCGGGSAATVPTTTVEPIASCVSPELQRSSGVTVRGSDGRAIDALMMGTGHTGLVFANMSDNDLCGWLPMAQAMAKAGYRTAVFSYSSGGDVANVVDVAKELGRRGATKLALLGASMGGTFVIGAANQVGAEALVELSAPSNWGGVDAEPLIKSVTVPTWMAVADGDDQFVPSAQRLYAASGAKVKHLETLGGAQHGTGLLTPALQKEIKDFLAQHAPVS